jgi:hypothetical protein
MYNQDDISGLGSHAIATGGVIPVTLTVTDANGNVSSCTSTITLQDNTPPVIVCPTPPTPFCNAGTYTQSGTSWDATATDNCGIPNMTYTLSGATNSTGSTTLNGIVFNTGTTSVTWKATDSKGNFSTCQFNVVINAFPNTSAIYHR